MTEEKKIYRVRKTFLGYFKICDCVQNYTIYENGAPYCSVVASPSKIERIANALNLLADSEHTDKITDEIKKKMINKSFLEIL